MSDTNGAYSTVYTDALGAEQTSIMKDGKTLQVQVRGVRFSGGDFDMLAPHPADLERARSLFTLSGGDLCACTLEWTMPLGVAHHGRSAEWPLHARLELGEPRPSGGLAKETLALRLETPEGIFCSSGASGWFEDELLDLVRQMPSGISIHACITCAHSDYSPYGHGLFGGLACFRGAREAYAQVTSKADLFDVWSRMTEFVQETYLCGDYRERTPGTGYRG